MNSKHFQKLCRTSKFPFKEICKHKTLTYLDEFGIEHDYKIVKEYYYNCLVYVNGTIRKKHQFEFDDAYKKDKREYYLVTFSLHPEETKIVMNVYGVDKFNLNQKEFIKICNNKDFTFSKQQHLTYQSIIELKRKKREQEDKLYNLNKDFM